jgi:hypothetical protein
MIKTKTNLYFGGREWPYSSGYLAGCDFSRKIEILEKSARQKHRTDANSLILGKIAEEPVSGDLGYGE